MGSLQCVAKKKREWRDQILCIRKTNQKKKAGIQNPVVELIKLDLAAGSKCYLCIEKGEKSDLIKGGEG